MPPRSLAILLAVATSAGLQRPASAGPMVTSGLAQMAIAAPGRPADTASVDRSTPPEQPAGPPAEPAPHTYFEVEEFFSLHPPQSALLGFFGAGYRPIGHEGRPPVVDKTVFVFNRAEPPMELTVWVRAYAEPNKDRRLAVEWRGEDCHCHLDPTHVSGSSSGFSWQRAGTVPAAPRTFYQFRLHAVDGSEPIADAVLLTLDPEQRPGEEVRPPDDSAWTGGDGEGTTRINRSQLAACGEVELTCTYTAGPSGIAEGGGLRFFFPESWSKPQTTDPNAPGYLSAGTAREEVELLVQCGDMRRGAYAYSHELRHHHECFVRVVAGELRPDDEVEITFRGTVQPYTQSRDDFRNEVRAWYTPALPLGVSTDADADGDYWTVAPERSHWIEVVPGKPAAFSVVVPSMLAAGEPFAIKVAALDEYRNPVPGYHGALACRIIALDQGPSNAGQLPERILIGPGDGGFQHTAATASLAEPGAYAIEVEDAESGIVARSNPIRCTAEEPPYRIYWGDLHDHHRRCDGLRTFRQAAAHARDVAGSDLVALSPHACYITQGDLEDLWRVNDEFNDPGSFVTLFAYEWAGAGGGAGHSVLYSDGPMPFCFRGFGGGDVVRGRPSIYPLFGEHGLRLIEVPHHVRGVTQFDPQYTKAIEIYSQWGVHEPGCVKNFQAGLKACVLGTSDNHTGQPGLHSIANRWAIHHHYGGQTAFCTNELSRTALYETMLRRRCYAAADCRMIAAFSVEGHGMGEEFTVDSPEQARSVRIEGVSSTPIDRVVLMKNGCMIRQWEPGRCVVDVEHTDDEPFGGPTDFYHVRLESGQEKKAWLTPVWVNYRRPIPSPSQRFQSAIDKLDNLARGKPVTTSFPQGITHGEAECVTDGKLDDWLGHGTEGEAWVQVDLGQVHSLGAVRQWNYFRDGRTFRGVRLAVSETGKFAGEETVVFDGKRHGEYAESDGGRVFVFEPIDARYVRSWLNGSTSNVGSQWVEIEVYPPVSEP